jgi:hypothetical protein
LKANTLEDELLSLKAMYGLASVPKLAGEIEILSSQEPYGSAAGNSSAPASGSSNATYVQYNTPSEVVRLYTDGRKEISKLSPGDNGFLVGKFGSEVVETELPNLLLSPVMKKPAAARKKPAASAPTAANKKKKRKRKKKKKNKKKKKKQSSFQAH